MAKQLFVNNIATTISGGITNVATSITLLAGAGTQFPNPTAGDWFLVTLWDGASTYEVAKCTARTGDVLTVVRGQEGTSGSAFLTGSSIYCNLTKGTLENLVQRSGDTLNALTIGATTPGTGAFTTLTASGHTTFEGVTSTGATGTGKIVYDTSPAFTTPNLGTPSAAVLTNATGTAAGLTSGNVTTNANLTGHITSAGNAAVLGSFSLAQLNTAINDADVANLVSPAFTTPNIGVASGTSLTTTGVITSTGTAGVGYSTGAGGAVTQLTDKGTGVTLNKISGQITMSSANILSGASALFLLTNSTITTNDTMSINHVSTGTVGVYQAWCAMCQSGSAYIWVKNNSLVTLGEAIVLQFNVHKGASS